MVGAHWLRTTEKVSSDAEQSLSSRFVQLTGLRSEHLSRVTHPRVMLNEQYDWLRMSAEPCFSMCRKERELRSDLCSIGMDIETFRLASQQISATQRKSNVMRTSHRKSIQIGDSPIVRDG